MWGHLRAVSIALLWILGVWALFARAPASHVSQFWSREFGMMAWRSPISSDWWSACLVICAPWRAVMRRPLRKEVTFMTLAVIFCIWSPQSRAILCGYPGGGQSGWSGLWSALCLLSMGGLPCLVRSCVCPLLSFFLDLGSARVVGKIALCIRAFPLGLFVWRLGWLCHHSIPWSGLLLSMAGCTPRRLFWCNFYAVHPS